MVHEAKLLFEMYNNGINLLKARKYEINNQKKFDKVEDFWKEYSKKEIIISSDLSEEVIYIDRSSNFVKDIFIKNVKNIKKQYPSNKKIIMIIDKKIKKLILGYKKYFVDLKFEFLNYSTLYIDPTLHSKVPKFKLLTVDEKKDFLQGTNLTIKDLNKIRISDRIAVWYGAKKGDIFEITITARGNTINEIKYRTVI